MIELWNLANRRIDISFSFENSMTYLSQIAVQLMSSYRREMDKTEIKTCLPSKIESHSSVFFLSEMVLKAGLLYESEGKYGFLHLTFQEYLTAYFFAKNKNQNDILRFHDKDYWNETFKLFVNIGKAEPFFDDIIDNLIDDRNFWKKIRFWEECLDEVVVEKSRKAIRLKFAKKVVDILCSLKYKKEYEELICKLLWHYPLYKYSTNLEKEAWELFHNAYHPFVQSIGTSILQRCGNKVQAELMLKLKERINDFENNKNNRDSSVLYFFLQNHNNFLLQIARRLKLTDFYFVISKLKSENIEVQYLAFINLLDIRDFREIWGLKYILDLEKIINFSDIKELLGFTGFRYVRYLRDLRGVKDLRNLEDTKYITNLRKVFEKFIRTYKDMLINHRQQIFRWGDQAIEKLHSMTDEDLMNHFPNTTAEELKIFRENHLKND
jgi:hypothetical protein